MFRHQGRSRTIKHNTRIAVVLTFVAGIVNVTGFLHFHQLTTNVTGHFALFTNDVANLEFWKGTIYFLYIFSFLFGSFSSSYLIEKLKESKKLNVFIVPSLIESFVLLAIPLGNNFFTINANLIVCLLLFSMGLQNSFVTKISNAVVRTTHLTGLFTDLGIELSQLCFPKTDVDSMKLKQTIRLRMLIIFFFFLGGLFGGFMYSKMNIKLNTLFFGATILLVSLFYDVLKYKTLLFKRKYKMRQN